MDTHVYRAVWNIEEWFFAFFQVGKNEKALSACECTLLLSIVYRGINNYTCFDKRENALRVNVQIKSIA